MLKGKANEDFDKWYIPWIREQRPDYIKFTDAQILRKFYRKVFSEQYGVLVDWFDSVGIYINIVGNTFQNYKLYVDTDSINNFETRPQARQKAIERASEIYNER